MVLLSSAVVAGAGIGGAAAALALRRTGVPVTVLERVEDPRATGAALLLQPNGLAVLDGLGLGSLVRAEAWFSRAGVPVRDERGRPLVEAPVPAFGDGLDGVAVIRRSRLLGILHDALGADDGIDLQLGASVEGADARGTLSYRQGDETRQTTSELVVAADGVHSRVRARAGMPVRLHRTGVSYVRVMVPASPPSDLQGETWSRLGLFGVAPVPDGTYVYTSCSAPSLAAAVADQDLDAFRRVWTELLPAAGPVLDAIGDWTDLIVSDVTEVRCPRFTSGRLALLGDAAHAMAPNLGQGANSALVDAAVLALEVDGAPDLERALRAYDQRRRPAVSRVQNQASVLLRIGDLRNSAARGLRDAILRTAARAVPGDRAARALQQEEPLRLREALGRLSSG